MQMKPNNASHLSAAMTVGILKSAGRAQSKAARRSQLFDRNEATILSVSRIACDNAGRAA
jgi:hypothetical protein